MTKSWGNLPPELIELDFDTDSDDDAELLAITSAPKLESSDATPGSSAAVPASRGSSFFDKRPPSSSSRITTSQRSTSSRTSTSSNFGIAVTHHELNPDTLGSYIYPTNLPPRDYQMNIVQKALFNNVLCALPTGMGKTFIASTVMLNWYRWTVDAKIIFMAPTRPLVSQQIEACLGITGISKTDACVMIGTSRAKADGSREELWKSKRVFFCTPQIVEGDLKRGRVDPKSIACLVFDEAHRATGNYSYVEIVNFIYRFQQSCRILALTATPSGHIEGVQLVIDNLKISRTEIRTEDSLDVRQYIHKRNIVRVQAEPSEDEIVILDHLSKAVGPLLGEMNAMGVYYVREVDRITQFGALSALQKYMASPAGRNNKGAGFKVQAIMPILIKIGQAIHLLKVHGIVPFYNCINEMRGEEEQARQKNTKKKATKKSTLLNHEGFVACLDYCEQVIFDAKTSELRPDFIGHEKLRHVVDIMSDFFLKNEGSRAIIFAEYRDSAAEIERVLKYFCPINVRPHLFIGQSNSDKSKNKKNKDDTKPKETSRRGMRQKLQQEVVDKFKSGELNVLIATSIGEEGLDIGEVDLIVCFDQSKSPIRIIQRMGRTGRKREGQIYLLMTKEEEKKVDHSVGGYKFIQNQINDQEKFTYQENNRILPFSVRPICEKILVDIPEENKEILVAKDKAKDIVEVLKSTQKPTKTRKKATPKKFFMPDNVHTGFLQASALAVDSEGNVPPPPVAQLRTDQINSSEDLNLSGSPPKTSLSTVVNSSPKIAHALDLDSDNDFAFDSSSDIDPGDHKIDTTGTLASRTIQIQPRPQEVESNNDDIKSDPISSDDLLDEMREVDAISKAAAAKPRILKPPLKPSAGSLSAIIAKTKQKTPTSLTTTAVTSTPVSTSTPASTSTVANPVVNPVVNPVANPVVNPVANPVATPVATQTPKQTTANKTKSFEKPPVPALQSFFKQPSPQLSPPPPPSVHESKQPVRSETERVIASATGKEGFLSPDQLDIFEAVYRTDNAPDCAEYDPLIGAKLANPPHAFIAHSVTSKLFHSTIQRMKTLATDPSLKRPTLNMESPPSKRPKKL
ncbi:Mph1p [Sugiyamaella lignohabitans]|uniref:ATP-dependent DNA helicase n=1 Tax=Sugiyamaella lignohabitans TaxID=796027 RepID=A0A167FM35_9ASCO|nr:Mph1p [Sugiyamaella lignohabitans]ANB15469.1 Mph1p [Sugiyamaella lignohabitans]